MSLRVFVVLLALLIGAAPVCAQPSAIIAAPVSAVAPGLGNASAPAACGSRNSAFTVDDLSGVAAPCTTAPGSLLVETLYYQNASRVGGTALAAYPLFRLRTGILKRLEAVVDLPSQVAESGLGGAGSYPTTHLGYGLNYTFAAGERFASALGAEILPPGSRFVINQAQPKYVLDVTGGYQLTDRATVSAMATGSSSREVGFNRIFPAAAIRLAYDSSVATQISADLGMRFVARHGVAQNYGDIAVAERLSNDMRFTVGLGTTFNPVSNAKAHYLASGFDFRLK